MKLSTFALLAAVLLAQTTTANAKAYKGAEVYSRDSVLHGRVEMRMRMIRGSGLLSTFFTYKNGSEMAGETWEETDIEVLGKNDATSWQSNLITGNPRMTSEQVYSATSSLADGYHTYALEWTPTYVSWSFDGAVVRKTEGGQASSLINAASLRFNAWATSSSGWAGALDEAALPAYQFVNWIRYYRYDNGRFVLDWADDFDSFDSSRWGTGNWTFDGNLVDFDPTNAVVQDSTLILAITKEGSTGFSGTVPVDDGPGVDDGVIPPTPGSDSGCTIGGSPAHGTIGVCAMLLALGLAARRRRWRTVSAPRLTLAALLLGVLAPSTAFAVQGAELYRTQAYFYGRFEARVRYAPGEGVVSSFFLWKDGSSSTTSWHELDYEKINAACRMQTNVWTGKGTQNAETTTPTFDICGEYHTYSMEWTPDYIAWLIDGTQLRRVTGASVTEYTQMASQGMTIHFNLWPGDANFGGVFNSSILPVRQYVSWAQYSSYANGAFQLQWREEFNGSTLPSGWATGNWSSPANHSTHNPANVSFVNGIAVLSLTADNATGFTGTPPADTSGGTGGTSGAGGAGGTAGSGAGGGGAGRGGASGMAGGGAGRGGGGGSASPGSGGTSSTGNGGSGAAGSAGSGAGGTAAGTAGGGAAGTAAGTAGNGPGGATAGAAGSGAGGVAAGTAGSGAGGSSAGSGGSGTGGASTAGRGGAMAGGGSPGSAGGPAGGTGGPTDGDGGCGCHVTSNGLTGGGGLILAMLIAAGALRRRPRSANRARLRAPAPAADR
jgi:beta-glucanase (GH16 family)